MKFSGGGQSEKTALIALFVLVAVWIIAGFGFGDINIWGDYLNIGTTEPRR